MEGLKGRIGDVYEPIKKQEDDDTNDEVLEVRINELNLDIIPPSTINMYDPDKGGSKIVAIGKPGCFGRGTKVLMYNGYIKNVEDVQMSELVMGDDGTPRKVLDLCNSFDLMYRLKTRDNITNIIVNNDHILTLMRDNLVDIIDIPVYKYRLLTEEEKNTLFWFRKSVIIPNDSGQSTLIKPDNFYTKFSLEPEEYGEYFGFVLNKNHHFLLADLSVVHNTGKCLSPDTPVMLYSGEVVNADQVKVGDKLMGDDNTPRNVLSIAEGQDDMYLIIQNNGNNYIVNSSHILSVKYESEVGIVQDDIPILDILDDNEIDYYGYKVMVDFKKEDNPNIDFYNEGMKLILNEVYGDVINFQNTSTTSLHIPLSYLTASVKDRLSLLAGLTEYLLNFSYWHGIRVKIHSVSLRKDVVFLARTLGFSVNVKKENISIIGKNLSSIPFKTIIIENKEFQDDLFLLTNIRILPIGMGRYCGFEIDGNRRFLLGDCTVTHNTTLIDSILYAKKHIFPVGGCMSGTELFTPHWKKRFASTFLFEELNKNKVEDWLRRQKVAKSHLDIPWAVYLLEDLSDDPKFFKSTLFKKIMKMARHFKMMILISIQNPTDLPPNCINSIDGVFILRETMLEQREYLYKKYSSVLATHFTFSEFCSFLDQVCNNYCSLYINNCTSSTRLEDVIFYYKPIPPPKNFTIGCDEYWQFHQERYNPEYTDTI